MASYREKQIQKMTETESEKIAYYLNALKCGGIKSMKAFANGKSVNLFDNVSAYEQSLLYHIYKPVEDKPNRFLMKVVWMYSSYDEMVTMLDSQNWQYI